MGLLNDNLLFVDRETQSIWSQLDGKAISGQLKDQPLRMIPTIQTTWQHWQELHPDTRVWVKTDSEGYPYLYRNRQPGSPRPAIQPKAHDTSALGLGLVINNEAMFFPLKELAKSEPSFDYELGGQRITIHYNNTAPTAWAADADGHLLTGVMVYDFSWKRFYPESEIFRAEK